MTHDEKIQRYENAKMLAIRMHGLQDYDGFPYHKHLQDVENVLLKFGYDKYGDYIICAWLHDLLEDAPISYNDIKKQFGEKIAEIIYCVTDELGRNRKERKEKTYPKLIKNDDAIIIKLADRIANLEQSIKMNSKTLEMYEKEYIEFRRNLYKVGHVEEMWDYIDGLINKIKLKELSN